MLRTIPTAGRGVGLHVTERTVEWHKTAVFEKLGLEETPDDGHPDIHRRVRAVLTLLEE